MQNKKDRIVIKVGTSTITHECGNLNMDIIGRLMRVLCDLKKQGKWVVLVTSGAIGVGVARLGLDKRPTEIPMKQAAAAVGQCLLMGVYDKFASGAGVAVGQVLLTQDCIDSKRKYQHAINTFEALKKLGVIAVVNENDTVAVDEIVVGDNDTLSAYVANIIEADLLVLLSDVEGFLIDGKVVPEITCIDDNIKGHAGGAGTTKGTGGMMTKLQAVSIASKSKTKTVITSGKNPENIMKMIEGERVGTIFNLEEAK